MARDQLTYLWTTTGIKTLSLGMRPTKVTITVSKKDIPGNDDVSHSSQCVITDGVTGTWSNCHSKFRDSTGGRTFRFEDRIISHYERVGGVITEVFRVNFDSWTASGMKVNVVNKSGSDYVADVEYET